LPNKTKETCQKGAVIYTCALMLLLQISFDKKKIGKINLDFLK